MIRQAILLLVLSGAVGLGVNLVSPNKVEYIGKFRDLTNSDQPIVPPTAEPGDPPFVGINEAQMEFATGKPLFLDARNPEDFECGTIPGSVNIPFEALPEGDLSIYLDSALEVDKDHPIITFCSGEDCDLSLHMGRNLKMLGYTQVAIFFGGAREWEKFGLEMQRRKACGN